jgi:hypothetical protein
MSTGYLPMTKKAPAGLPAQKTIMRDSKFPVPHEIEDILELLPPQVTLNIPDHILSLWFPPGPTGDGMDGVALERAQGYAQSCGCRFVYHRSIREGIFYKPRPSEG